jgi:phospholipid/cholesterol/gamma-HCH transport system ATP-binding protein
MISVRNVSKKFGTQVVLDRISIDIEQGQTTAIVGPSGVGKSVLLKLIMGILDPDEGEITVFGESMTNAKSEAEKNEIRRNLGVLFQSAALFDSISVYDNVAFALRERIHLPEEEVHSRTVDMLESLGIIDYAKLYPEQIPLGTRKRVGMARCLVLNPKIILFDEPNTGLDPLVGQEVYNLIKDGQERWGVSGVVISHELPEVFQVSDRVAMILGGKIIFEGTPTDFIESSEPAVQQFLHGKIDGPIKIQ